MLLSTAKMLLRFVSLFLLCLGLLRACPAAGQAQPEALPSQWGWGVRGALGYTTSPYRNSRRGDDLFNHGSIAGGLVVSRYLAKPRASICLEALFESQWICVTYQQAVPYSVYGPQTVLQGRLFVPLYLRTGTPASVLHGLLGAGPVLALGHSNSEAAYHPRLAELALLVGVELRLAPWHRYETTLGFRLQAPLTPSYEYSYPIYYINQGVNVTGEARNTGFSRWLGFTLATTLYPAAKR